MRVQAPFRDDTSSVAIRASAIRGGDRRRDRMGEVEGGWRSRERTH
jgi:hypothetical protein